jgi:predicted O-linked N-acetylglucosamine transferase (SPINDLY family)
VRIGYLSGNLREHVVAHTVRALFEHHDRTRFEVLAYALGADDGSAIRARIADLADGFIDLSGLRDAAAAERINADGVELLVDLDGYTTGARPGVLARRPAPVQLVYQGYWGPLGAGLVDYVVSGVRSTPRQALEGWDESCVLLPGAAIVYGYREDQQYRPTRAACGLPEQATVLACFSRTYKIDPEVYAVWMRALHAAPQAVLWLMADGPEVPQNLRREAVRRGVDPGRILFARWCPPHEHVARCALADVFLDTLHFGGHTTALDALWAGVPLVSCRGEGPYGRIGAAVLEEAGLDELAVDGLGNYEALALRLATDDAYRHVVRGRAAIARAGPLFDERRRVRHVEAALAAVSSRHRLGQPPADLVVAEDGATRPLGA